MQQANSITSEEWTQGCAELVDLYATGSVLPGRACLTLRDCMLDPGRIRRFMTDTLIEPPLEVWRCLMATAIARIESPRTRAAVLSIIDEMEVGPMDQADRFELDRMCAEVAIRSAGMFANKETVDE